MNWSRMVVKGTRYSSPGTDTPPFSTGRRAGNRSPTEKNRYFGAVCTYPMKGCSAMV
jgi:hypothetical protein